MGLTHREKQGVEVHGSNDFGLHVVHPGKDSIVE